MTWNHARRSLRPALLGLLALVAPSAAQDSPRPPIPLPPIQLEPLPQVPSVSWNPPLDLEHLLIPPPLGTSVALAPANPVARARAQDDAGFRAYLHEREILIERGHLGHWIAIEGGQLLPKSEGRLAPMESLAALLFLIDGADSPKSLHRYLFRIGEEGDVAYHYFAPNLPHSDALGVGLFRATFLDEPESDVVFAPDRIYAKRGGKRHDWTYGQTGIELALEDPARTVVVHATVTPSNACDGTFVLSSATAAKLALARFEIPGTCWYGPEDGQRLACRRARLRWRVAELDVDATLPVAIWPER